MPSGTFERTLDNPFGNHPAKEPFEQFVDLLGRELSPHETLHEMQIQIAQLLCREFNFKPPVHSDKIKKFLDFVGIHLDEAPQAQSTLFMWNPVMSRYEIKTRTCWQQEWSLDISHEVWEIIFWRCYHKIRWWKQWAANNKVSTPHDKADEFAYHFLLSPQSVAAQAKKRCYNVYEVAKYYSVPTNLAFRALSCCNNYEHPVMMALLHLNAGQPSPEKVSCLIDLFNQSQGFAHAKVWKRFIKPGKAQQDNCGLDFQGYQLQEAETKAFKVLDKYLKTNETISFEEIDPLYCYGRHSEPKEWTVPHVLGLDLPTPMTVITQQSPYKSSELLLQIMPPRFTSAYIPPKFGASDFVCWSEQTQFQQAARSIQPRPPRILTPIL